MATDADEPAPRPPATAMPTPIARPPGAILNQNEIDSLLGFGDGDGRGKDSLRHPRHHRFGARLLRAPADARSGVRPAGAHDVDVAAQFHLGQCRRVDRQHHLDPLRRLSQFDPAAGDAERLPAEQWDNYGADDRRQRADLFDRRRAARRPPRHRGDAHRGPALHHHRAQSRRAPRHGRARAIFRRAFDPLSPVTFRFDRLETNPRFATIAPARPMPPCSRACASTWRIAAAASRFCCLTRRWSRCARSCCKASSARSSAAIRSGKRISPASCGTPACRSRRCSISIELSLRDVINCKVGIAHPAERRRQLRRQAGLRRPADVHRQDGAQGRRDRGSHQR